MPKQEETKPEKVVTAQVKDNAEPELKDAVETVEEKTGKAVKPIVVAEATEKKIKKVKVKFLENHELTAGSEKHTFKKGATVEIEPHLANKLLERKIAYIVG